MSTSRYIIYAICCIGILLSTSITVMGQTNPPASQNDPLEIFLRENGLNRMLITHLEVRAENAPNDRGKRIEQLHQAYATELFRRIENEAWSKNVLAKAKFSLAAHPNRKSERLRLAVAHREIELLQRDYLRAAAIGKTDVDQITEEIDLIQRGVKQQIENLDRLTELKQTEIGDARLLSQLRQQFRHGEYLLGWSHFFESAASLQHSKPVLRDAESSFRSFLDLDPHANLTKFSADQFGNQSRFQTMATAGLGAVMQGIGADKQAAYCFQTARENASLGLSAESEVDTINQWEFAGYLRDDRDRATKMLEDHTELLRNNELLGAILKRSNSADKLVEKALSGLTLMREVDQLRAAMESFPDAFSKGSGDASVECWIRGYLSLDDFQKDEEDASLEQATLELSTATKQLDPQLPAEIRGHCRFLLASCLHLNKNYPDAAREFAQAAELLRRSEDFRLCDEDLAAEAAYRAIQSVRLIVGEQKPNQERIAAWLNANAPASAFTKLANFDLDLERRDALSDQDAIDYLNRFRENESSVLVRSAASIELARRYRLANKTPIARFRNYVNAIESDSRISDDARIQTYYYYVSKLLALPNPLDFSDEINDVLANVKAMVEGTLALNQRKPQAAKFLYFQSLALKTLQRDNYTIAHEYFQRVKQSNHSSPWTAAAALEIAKIFENAETEEKVGDPIFRRQMISLYEFVSNLPNAAMPTNQEVVAFQLARLYLADDRLLEAESQVEGLAQKTQWLPIRAKLAEKKNDLRGSAMLWQQLEKQFSPGTVTWLDARLERLLVLYQFDKQAAQKLLRQTIALHPNMPADRAIRFGQLADRWGRR